MVSYSSPNSEPKLDRLSSIQRIKPNMIPRVRRLLLLKYRSCTLAKISPRMAPPITPAKQSSRNIFPPPAPAPQPPDHSPLQYTLMPEPDLNPLFAQLDSVMLRDRHFPFRRLRGIERSHQSGRPIDHPLAQVMADLERSRKRREDRQRNLPKPTYPEHLPVVEKREEIKEAIAKNQFIVLCGETGSGKTTQLPKICLELGRGVAGLIGHTQPRRIAARTVAKRISEEL